MWGTLQSRLTVEMRIRGIKTLEEANRFLRKYAERHNAQFTEEAADTVSDFLPCPAPESLRLILGYRDERKASSGSEISWKGAKYQLVDEKGKVVLLRGGEAVTVVQSADGTLFALREGEKKETSYGLIPSLGGEKTTKERLARRAKRSVMRQHRRYRRRIIHGDGTGGRKKREHRLSKKNSIRLFRAYLRCSGFIRKRTGE